MDVFPAESKLRATLEAADAAVVPVWTEVLCDTQTPLGAFARLRDQADTAVLLESVVGGERWARYSFLALGHRLHGRAAWEDGALRWTWTAPEGFTVPADLPTVGLQSLRAVARALHGEPQPDLPRFWGGLVGVCGHDFVRAVESLPPPAGRKPEAVPGVEMIATDVLVIFDNLTQRVKVVGSVCPATDGGFEAGYARAVARVKEVVDVLQGHGPAAPTLRLREPDPSAWECEPAEPWSRARHIEAVAAAKEHIVAGDVFQVVLSQAFDTPRAGLDLLDVYRALRVTNPAPYMYAMQLPSATLVGASPEVLVRVDRESRQVTVRPIAGTRPRGRTQAEDLALERELLADPKERAEHLMLVDLGRNDIGRVSEGGSVRMTDRFSIERYSRVMHIVSEVTGILRPEFDAIDALAATFPAGTLSGAPKVRALELIDELEVHGRGWYGGAVGYLGYDGGADFAICIRSLVAQGDTLRVQAGGGIVHDSDAQAEDQECRNKASAVLRAIAMARGARENQG
ncbi:MAG: anthranilate synthase component I family protein [Nannocystaceae bacterium]|nr:anthranilate synthase component I family protein [Nannocystaceae bacterium]